VNPLKFAEQEKKRKLLWSKKTEPAATWTSTTFSQDTDGTKANKFLRLMGVKDGKKNILNILLNIKFLLFCIFSPKS
jgi:uncharacterized membrane protein